MRQRIEGQQAQENNKFAQSEKLQAEIEDLIPTIAFQGKKIGTPTTLAKQKGDLTKAMRVVAQDRAAESSETETTVANTKACSSVAMWATLFVWKLRRLELRLQQPPC